MSILIKGMEMPHDCDECKLCAIIPVGDYGINRKCMPLNAKAEITIRRTDCPLVPVPKHRRLGDLDALAVEMEDEHLGGYVGESWREIRQIIADAPTILPAEEGLT